MGDTLDRFMLLFPGGAWFFAAMTHAIFGDGSWIWIGGGVGICVALFLAYAGRAKDG